MVYIYTMEYYLAIKNNKIMPCAATWMELETLILNEVSQKEKDKYGMISWYDITYICNLIYTQRNLSTEEKIMDLENRLVVAKGDGEGVEWLWSLGLMDANYCLWNRLAMRSCCAALGTM